ncbi:unnamed protein product [Microthlaspi erraticum]|uniref:Ubiquitin-like protease family profile domain-containing protein n=1 Tax=Microthlaspi erraticum TaxID=1685480 RepID=A0A6D2JT89_9BRAS|nr:unnamed protein product [Microthlaspi erraticum]
MEVIMTMLWRRRGEVLVKDRAVFVESAFTSLVASMYPVFKICDDKSAFDWGNNVRSFVSGKSQGKKTEVRICDERGHVVRPDELGNDHWVGLVIDIPGSYVEVLDPYVDYNHKEAVVEAYMEPVVQSMPWILKRYVGPNVTTHMTTNAYGWARTGGLYQNTRAGDCRPCAAKFLEMHAHRLHEEMSTVTDEGCG